MTETPLRSITNSGIWIPMLAPTCSTMISSDEPRCRGFNQSRIQFPLSISTLLARDSIIGIPIPCSISLPSSWFTCSIMHDPVNNHFVTLSSLWWCITEWAQRYLSVIRSDKSQSRSVPTQQTLSEIPVVHLYSHPVMLWRLAHPKHSYGIRELHDLMVKGKDIWHWKTLANELYDLMLCLGLGLVHHIILLMMWSRYQWHPMSIVRKPWLYVDQRASQLEAY